MHRLNLVETDKAEPEAKALLDAVQRKMGLTPNMMRVMANSPAVLRAYGEFSGALAEGLLPARLREQSPCRWRSSTIAATASRRTP